MINIPFITDLYANRAWAELCRLHISPSRAFRLALGLDEYTAKEGEHLETCERCRHAIQLFRSSMIDLQTLNGARPEDVAIDVLESSPDHLRMNVRVIQPLENIEVHLVI